MEELYMLAGTIVMLPVILTLLIAAFIYLTNMYE